MSETMEIQTNLEAVRAVEQAVLREVNRYNYSVAAIFAIKLALEEALNNAIKHGNRMDPRKKVKVAIDIDANRAAMTITDEGNGFDLSKVPDPRADENLERPCGRGIMLMFAYMDEVRYNEKGNQIHVVKQNV